MNAAQYIPFIAALLGFVAVLLGVYGILGFLSGAGNVERIRARVEGRSSSGRSASRDVLAELGESVMGLFSRLGRKVGPQEDEEIGQARLKLVRAGVRNPDAFKVFQGSKLLLAVGLLAVALLARAMFLGGLGTSMTLFLLVGGAALGMYLPDFWLRSRRKKRLTSITNSLPDSLDLLVVCVESGMGLDQAITRVSEEIAPSSPELSEELYLLTLELRAGKKRSEALKSLSRRVGLDDLNSLVTLLIQADIFGISVGKTLRVYSDAMRKKRRQKAEEAAAKLPVKLMLPLILFILPALFLTILGPAGLMLADLFKNMPGR
ncbi:type II secretion system F family protein [Salidesulfovibrio onnuriiensis]|uniref:type II secretion system F family protein n=1 Tax=Salidesulfovibrio onnuriiensis TaxID=2583823 RepID=UPI0011CA438B|nr:type II secretion system F family protein [Salidesulfovibrio onnuriiensis]